MELNILYIALVWGISIIADFCFIRILDETTLNFSDIVNRELPFLIIICILAPVVFLILLLGVFSKIGIKIANALPLVGEQKDKKECSRCIHICNNECTFFKLKLRPKMLCKGRFFNELEISINNGYTIKTGGK